jgi:nucleoside-diphosphate-sugar epimerase
LPLISSSSFCAASTPRGALPARFRRERVLIVGCGDVGQRVLPWLTGRVRVLALTSTPAQCGPLRALGATPLLANLDQPKTLARLAGLAHRLLHLAPPQGGAETPPRDERTRALLRALRRRTLPAVLVYGSTSGVYGDCAGEFATEIRAKNATTTRAYKRIDAEENIKHLGRATSTRVSVLRIPGIYAPNRVEGMPLARLRERTPVLHTADDVYTNHIHADDLARACVAALWRGKPQRVFNINDDTVLKMGDYFDLAADLYGLARPPRIALAVAATQLTPLRLSFMRESRRMDNTRMKRELRVSLRYPTVATGLLPAP